VRSPGWAPIAGWCAATATSIVLASAAILPVLRAPAPVDGALAQLPAAATSFPAPLPSVTIPRPPATGGPAPSRTPASRKPRPAGARPARSTPPPRTEDGWTVTTDGDGLRTYVRTFTVEGGQAVVRVTSDAVVSLVTATPADGFAVQKVQNSPDNLAVYFNETNHSFIIHAVWFTDRPFAEVSEVGK